MKTNPLIRFILCGMLLLSSVTQAKEEPRSFTNREGKKLTGILHKYDSVEEVVSIEMNFRTEKIPLATFSDEDQAYIKHWDVVRGFLSTMRFKLNLNKKNWGRMNWSQTVTPSFLDPIQLPGKKDPLHEFIQLEDYEEYQALNLKSYGYEIEIRNQNPFPIKNLTIEHKLFYKQEQYLLGEDIFKTSQNEYTDVVETNKVKYGLETLPVLEPLESITLYSRCATIVDAKINITDITAASGNSDNASDDEEDEETVAVSDSVEGFGEWEDSGRNRSGEIVGVWFRVGITGLDGEMIYREIASPDSLMDKITWDEASGESVTNLTTTVDSEISSTNTTENVSL